MRMRMDINFLEFMLELGSITQEQYDVYVKGNNRPNQDLTNLYIIDDYSYDELIDVVRGDNNER